MDENQIQITSLIASEFDLSIADGGGAGEEALFRMLSERIAWLLEHNMEYLLSLLYRNDVAEEKIHRALSPAEPTPANEALARLVLERQKERIATRKRFGRQDNPEVDEDLRW